MESSRIVVPEMLSDLLECSYRAAPAERANVRLTRGLTRTSSTRPNGGAGMNATHLSPATCGGQA